MMKSSKKNDGIVQEETAEIIAQFATQLMVYGGPEVIKALGNGELMEKPLQKHSPKILLPVDKLLRAMRENWGIRNKEIEGNEILGLIMIRGKPELEKLLGDA